MTTDVGIAGLSARSLSVQYGGLRAVRELSIDAPSSRLTGLIGPNGAGKTTTFNALCGLVKPSGGTVHLFDRDLRDASTAERARRGLGRTFQRMELFDSLTVADNLVVGCEAKMAGANPFRQLVATRSEREAVSAAVADALEMCDLDDLAHQRAGALSTGQRRRVELARAIAGSFPILLLDEPSSGLDAAETRRFGDVLRRLIATRGTGILLVEHDMALVMEVCDYLYVIDFGQLIFEGTPADVVGSSVVREAYLGSGAGEVA